MNPLDYVGVNIPDSYKVAWTTTYSDAILLKLEKHVKGVIPGKIASFKGAH